MLPRRLDGHVTGAPESPALDAILRILFHPDDLLLVHRLPIRLTPLDILAGRPPATPTTA